MVDIAAALERYRIVMAVAEAVTIVNELKNCLRFWEHALDVMKMHHVFELPEALELGGYHLIFCRFS